jgi:DNA-binding protein HU-beta
MASKIDLARMMTSGTPISIEMGKDLIDNLFDSISECLYKDGHVEIRGFGTFNVKDTPPRKLKSALNGVVYDVPARKRTSFKASKELKQRVNG